MQKAELKKTGMEKQRLGGLISAEPVPFLAAAKQSLTRFAFIVACIVIFCGNAHGETEKPQYYFKEGTVYKYKLSATLNGSLTSSKQTQATHDNGDRNKRDFNTVIDMAADIYMSMKVTGVDNNGNASLSIIIERFFAKDTKDNNEILDSEKCFPKEICDENGAHRLSIPIDVLISPEGAVLESSGIDGIMAYINDYRYEEYQKYRNDPDFSKKADEFEKRQVNCPDCPVERVKELQIITGMVKHFVLNLPNFSGHNGNKNSWESPASLFTPVMDFEPVKPTDIEYEIDGTKQYRGAECIRINTQTKENIIEIRNDDTEYKKISPMLMDYESELFFDTGSGVLMGNEFSLYQQIEMTADTSNRWNKQDWSFTMEIDIDGEYVLEQMD